MKVAQEVGMYAPRGPGDPDIVYPNASLEEKRLHWQALTALFQRPWWQRAWIVQEVAIPKFVTVHCGDTSCPLQVLATTAQIMQKMNENLGYKPVQNRVTSYDPGTKDTLHLSCYQQVNLLATLRQVRSASSFLDLREMICHMRTCQATDTRDKVFGVLGLVDFEIYELRADYRLSVKEAYTLTTQRLITKTRRLEILGGCQNPEGRHDLPSWVPNLEDPWKARPVKYDRMKHRSFKDEADFSFGGEDGTVLRVQGYSLDLIQLMSADEPSDDDSLETIDAVYQSWKEFISGFIRDIPNTSREFEDRKKLSILLEQGNEESWIRILSMGTDNGWGLRFSEDGKTLLPEQTLISGTIGNFKMAKSFLLPEDEDDNPIKPDAYQRIHKNLRVYGVGRRLAITTKGHACLVPMDARIGDEICSLSGAGLHYVLRRITEEEHVLVGETCKSIPSFVQPSLSDHVDMERGYADKTQWFSIV